MQTPSLNIIGAGRLGLTLAKLFVMHNCFSIKGVCNHTITSAQQAVHFLGTGTAYKKLSELPPADIVMITPPDHAIKSTVSSLANLSAIKESKLIFHCSGAITSSILLPLKHLTNTIASVHPNMTFASPMTSIDHFAGTYCALEGEADALRLLEKVFQQIGGKILYIPTDKKIRYHAASVMSCNHLVGLLDMAIDLYITVGISRENALAMMKPIVTKTIDNVFNMDTAAALTGPIARGDVHTVEEHLHTLHGHYKAVYQLLSLQLIKLSLEQGNAHKTQLDIIQSMLDNYRQNES